MGTSHITQTDAFRNASILGGLRRCAVVALLLAGLLCGQRSAADSMSGGSGSAVTLTPLKEATGTIAARPNTDISLSVLKQRNGQGIAGEQVDWTVSGPGAATLTPDRAATAAQTATADAGVANTVFHAGAPGRYVVIATSQKNPGCVGDPCASFISTRFNLDVADGAPAAGGGSSSGPSKTEVIAAVAIGAALAIAASNNGSNHEQPAAVPVARSLTGVSGDGQSAAANTPLAQPLVVHAGNDGTSAAGVAINWSASGGATLSSPQTFTDAAGMTSVRILNVGSGPGQVVVTGTRSDNPGATVSFTITIILPSIVIVSGDGQTGFTSATVASPLVIEALLGSSPQSNVPIAWTITGGDATVSSVSNSDRAWPPRMTLARLARVPAPGPSPIAMGIMATTSITVVIRIGRRRVRLASKIASSRGRPCIRS